jgi:hypothetical protein
VRPFEELSPLGGCEGSSGTGCGGREIPLRMHMAARHRASGKPAHRAAVVRTPSQASALEAAMISQPGSFQQR